MAVVTCSYKYNCDFDRAEYVQFCNTFRSMDKIEGSNSAAVARHVPPPSASIQSCVSFPHFPHPQLPLFFTRARCPHGGGAAMATAETASPAVLRSLFSRSPAPTTNDDRSGIDPISVLFVRPRLILDRIRSGVIVSSDQCEFRPWDLRQV